MQTTFSRFCTLLLSSCFILFAHVAVAEPESQTMIVIDAGSSGTRAYLYEAINTDGRITINTIKNFKIGTPVTSVTDFDPYFASLLHGVQDTTVDNSNTPIYLHATAGVRMLSQADQDDLMDSIRVALSTQAAALQYPDMTETLTKDVDVLSATEEAFYIWINDQYVTGNLEQSMLTVTNTIAAVEMGGASAEVSMLLRKGLKDGVKFDHQDKKYRVYSVGYDGSGQDKALASMLDAHTAGDGFEGCFPVDAPYPLNTPILEGTGDFTDCLTFIENNPVNEYARAPFANQYLLTSGFYYTFNVLGLADDKNPKTVTLNDLSVAGSTFCATPWETLKVTNPSQAENYLITYCFNGAFQHHYLKEVGVNQWAKLLSTDKYNGTKPMTWTLGVAYEKAKQ